MAAGELQRRIGANLRRLRLANGHTQESLAAHLGYHRTYIGGIERGERNVRLSTVQQLADLLEIDVVELCRPPDPAT